MKTAGRVGRFFSGLLTALWLFQATAFAAYTPFRVASQIGGSCHAVAVSGNYAYIGEGPNLTVLNITNPQSPVYVSRLRFENLVLDVVLAGSRAYVAIQGNGIAIVDVSNVASLKVLGRYTTPGDPRRLDFAGGYLYIAYYNLSGMNASGLMILNVSNPASPLLAKDLNTYSVVDVDVDGNQAYCVGDTKLRVFNVAAPASASLVKTVDLPNWGNARALQVVNKKIYVCVDNSEVGLQVYDIFADPLNPAAQGHCIVDQPYDVSVVNNRAYVATLNMGLKAVNISNADSPILAGGLALEGQGASVAAAGAYACMASRHGGFHIVNVSTDSAFVRESGRAIATNPHNTRVVGTTAYLADGSQDLQFFDLSQPNVPRYLGRHDLGIVGEPEDVEIVSNKAYVGGSYGLFGIVSIADLAHPATLGTFSAPSWISQLSVQGNFAFLACQSAGTVVLNIANPAAPAQVAQLAGPKPSGSTSASVFSIAVSGQTVYAGYTAYGSPGANGMQVMNFVSSPVSLTQTRDYPSAPGTPYDVEIASGRAYLSCFNRGIEVISLAGTGTPQYLGSYSTYEYAFQTALLGSLAVVADAETIQVLDVSNPASIVRRQIIDLPGALQHVTAFGSNKCLVSSREGGLYILEPANAATDWMRFE